MARPPEPRPPEQGPEQRNINPPREGRSDHITPPAGPQSPHTSTQETDPPPNANPPHVHDPHVDRSQRIDRRRPVGMVLIAALILFNLVGAVTGLLGMLFAPGPAVPGAAPAAAAAPLGSVLYLAVLAVVLAVLLYGFWTFRRWGWTGTLVITALGIVLGLVQLFAYAATAILFTNIIGILIGIAVIWYLTRPEVRARFDR